MFISDLSEAELIARVHRLLVPPPDWLVVGIGDDAAVVEPARNRLEVLTVDALVEGIHFDRRFAPPGAIGHRALAVNLSDIAAMGADPRLALLSFLLPPELPLADFDAMVEGLTALAARHRVHVVGGNLTRSPGPLVLDVTVAGSVKRRRALTRSGARPGDAVYVTGTIGGAAAGLQMLKRAPRDRQEPVSPAGADAAGRAAAALAEPAASCERRYLYPEPRVRVGQLLGRNRLATACMDLSDGLADGARQIAAASGVGMEIDSSALPIDVEAQRWFEAQGDDAAEQAVSGGDDYELIFTVRPRRSAALKATLRSSGVAVTKVGICTVAQNVTLKRGASESPMPHGYKHFR